MDLKEFKEKYPDLYKLIVEEGKTAGHAEGLAEGEVAGIETGRAESQEESLKAGAQAERERIKGIEDLAMPGHEALVQTMKFDGETTPAAAAIKLVQAENAVRLTAAAALATDGIDPVTHVATDGAGTDDDPANIAEGPEKWKADYEASDELKKDDSSAEVYVAYKEAVAAGRVRSLKKS